MRVLSVLGARPQFVKAAIVSRELRKLHTEILVHTGQHYDENLSEVFFRQLEIPRPDYNLEVGSGLHGRQTGEMLSRLEAVIMDERPDLVLTYGDTNSTLAGALSASKLHVPTAHVESGMRSGNRQMPEEINRIVADHLSDLLFASTPSAVANLALEGISRGVHLTGDVMNDLALEMGETARSRSSILARLGLESGEYALMTLHRAENTDDPERLRAILEALQELPWKTIFPVHPRTRKAMAAAGWDAPPNGGLTTIDPVGYLDVLALEQASKKILTDSGGVQKEAYAFGIPCVTLRDETEWVETVEAGWNRLAGADRERIREGCLDFWPSGPRPPLFGDGRAAEQIARLVGEGERRFGDG